MKYKEVFESYGGYRFYKGRRSILTQGLAYGRRLTDEQLLIYASAFNSFLDGVAGKTRVSEFRGDVLTRKSFPFISNNRFYKYVSDEVLAYLLNGSFQFGTAKYYRDTENMGIQDDREGMSVCHFGHEDDQLHVSLLSGFNCAIFCGTSDCGVEEDVMRNRFGQKLICIKNLQEFMKQVAILIGAKKCYVRDVVYTDTKNCSFELPGITRFSDISGKKNLSDKKIRNINKEFFDVFHDYSLFPSLFSKPLRYSQERERRLVFEMPEDILADVKVVADFSLASYIEVIE